MELAGCWAKVSSTVTVPREASAGLTLATYVELTKALMSYLLPSHWFVVYFFNPSLTERYIKVNEITTF